MLNFNVVNDICHNFANRENCKVDSIEIYMFPQLWGSTALGYDGFGGSAMTKAETIVLHSPNGNVLVSFDGRRPIILDKPTEDFWKDVKKQQIATESEFYRYVK